MRLAPFFPALIFAAPLFAQTQDSAPATVPPSFTITTADQATVEKLLKENLQKLGDGKTITLMTPESVCSVPLVKAPIPTPDQYADRALKPSEVESIPRAVLPAPPCK
jgi:hypothetical protein